jgi:hypothetical protein
MIIRRHYESRPPTDEQAGWAPTDLRQVNQAKLYGLWCGARERDHIVDDIRLHNDFAGVLIGVAWVLYLRGRTMDGKNQMQVRRKIQFRCSSDLL